MIPYLEGCCLLLLSNVLATHSRLWSLKKFQLLRCQFSGTVFTLQFCVCVCDTHHFKHSCAEKKLTFFDLYTKPCVIYTLAYQFPVCAISSST